MSSRRDFIRNVSAVAGGSALTAIPSLRSAADATESLKVGFISPRSGPLAGFGEGDPYVLELARKALANGVNSGGKTYGVEILDRDTQSDPTRAGQLAKELINGNKIDFMLTTSTPEVVNPVADACEAAGVPCLSTIVPWEAWYFGRGAKPGGPSPFKWTYHFSFGVKNFLDAYVPIFHSIPSNKKIAVLYPNDADGNAIRHSFDSGFGEGGLHHRRSRWVRRRHERLLGADRAFQERNDCELFNTFPIPPDFATFWRQAAQQGYTRRP